MSHGPRNFGHLDFNPSNIIGAAELYRTTGDKKYLRLTEEYFDLVKVQLTELTTRYPECHYFWIDHPGSATAEQLADIYEQLRRSDPSNIVLFNTHLAVTAVNKPSKKSAFEQSHGFGFPADVIDSEGAPPHPPPRTASDLQIPNLEWPTVFRRLRALCDDLR